MDYLDARNERVNAYLLLALSTRSFLLLFLNNYGYVGIGLLNSRDGFPFLELMYEVIKRSSGICSLLVVVISYMFLGFRELKL